MDNKDESPRIDKAAEYALGLLSSEERQAFEEQMAESHELRESYRQWAEKFALLSQELPEQTPSPIVKKQLMNRLFEDNTAAANESSQSSWANWLFGWPGRSLGAVLAISLLAVVFILDPNQGFTPDYTASLQAEDQTLQVDARFDAEQQLLKLNLLVGNTKPGRDMELWLIVDQQAPVSLGVINTATKDIRLDATLAENFPNATLALSDEPLGGSPTGQPTGDILALGAVKLI